MTAAEFSAARRQLNWSVVQTAVAYSVTPPVVEGWEEGTLRIPKSVARDLRWRAAVEAQREILESSGLPECAEARSLLTEHEKATDLGTLRLLAQRFEAHTRVLCWRRDIRCTATHRSHVHRLCAALGTGRSDRVRDSCVGHADDRIRPHVPQPEFRFHCFDGGGLGRDRGWVVDQRGRRGKARRS